MTCAGADTMRSLVDRWSAALARTTRSPRIHIDSRTRLSADGFVAMLAGRVDCVTFAREMFPAEIAAFEATYGERPRPIPVAGGSVATLHATHAIAIYVNAANPLARLNLADLERILADGAESARRWGDIGLGGRWARAPIHVYGMTPYRASGSPPGIVNYLRTVLLHGRELRRDLRIVEPAPGGSPLAGIVRRVAADPDGIGFSGIEFASAGVRALPIARAASAHAWLPTARTVADGRYALARRIYLLFAPRSAARGAALLRFALGDAGQALVPQDDEHFLALPKAERAQALAAIDAPPEPSAAARLTRELPGYRPRAVTLSPRAAYRTPGGAIAVVGYNDMRTPLAAIDLLFEASHPGLRFALRLEGTRTAPPALAQGTSLFAPMGAPFEDAALAAYRRALGADPVEIRVAHDAIDPAARSSPLGVFVARDNPLERLDLAGLAAAFAPARGTGAPARWSALGVRGPWGSRPIHRYGPAPDTALGRFLAREVFANRPFAPDYRGSHESRNAIARAAQDPDALAIADLNQCDPRLKIVALARCAHCAASRGRAADLIAGRYPLDRQLLIYLRRTPGRGLDPLAREYLRLVLSREGQAALAAAPPHYLPLNPAELAAGRATLRPNRIRAQGRAADSPRL